MSNAFNTHFTSMGTKSAAEVDSQNENIDYDRISSRSSRHFEFSEIVQYDILKLVEKLSTRKASSLDKIPVFFLKLSAATTIESLTYIINLAIRNPTVPNDWKSASVTPHVHKEGCKVNPNNYRPISVLSVISKIFEKLIFDQ
ncbi:Hypothetical predicted protein, partial [Paramuricea clavata]